MSPPDERAIDNPLTKLSYLNDKLPFKYDIIKSNKGKETDREERREDDLARPAAEQARNTKTPHKPQTEHRSQGRKPEGQGTGTTAGASYREGANPTPAAKPKAETTPTHPLSLLSLPAIASRGRKIDPLLRNEN